VCRFR